MVMALTAAASRAPVAPEFTRTVASSKGKTSPMPLVPGRHKRRTPSSSDVASVVLPSRAGFAGSSAVRGDPLNPAMKASAGSA